MLPKNQLMHLDISQALSGLNYLDKVHMPAKINIGLRLAGTKFMSDTVSGVPAMPIRRTTGGELTPYGGERLPGGLRGSGALFVNGVKKGTTVSHGIPQFQPVSYGGLPIAPFSKEACVVFNAPYAAEQHEQWPYKTEPTAGRYFMSTKLYGNAVVYMGIITRAVKL